MSDSCYKHEDLVKIKAKPKGIMQFGASTMTRLPVKKNKDDEKVGLIANPKLQAEFD